MTKKYSRTKGFFLDMMKCISGFQTDENLEVLMKTFEAMYLSFRYTLQNSCLEAFKACHKNLIIFITT